MNANGTALLVLSYLGLRKALGLIGVALPFTLALGSLLLDGTAIRDSVSAYYYSTVRDVFVGSLCAMAVFFMSYRGYERKDDIAGDIACGSVLGIALFPTTPQDAETGARILGALHLICAAAFFLTVAYFSLALFRKTGDRPPTPQKLQRNKVYSACGYTILVCLASMAALKAFAGEASIIGLNPVYWLEATAIVAFGVSWLTKGEAILKDGEP